MLTLWHNRSKSSSYRPSLLHAEMVHGLSTDLSRMHHGKYTPCSGWQAFHEHVYFQQAKSDVFFNFPKYASTKPKR